MLSLPEIALIMNNQHYHFLSQSLCDLKHHIERHRAPCFHPYNPPSNPSSHNWLCECHALVDVSSTWTGKDQNRRRPLNDPLYLHTKRPTWDQERTPFMFLMMMTHIARDVGKMGTSLGTVIENIDLTGDNMCRYRKERTPWLNQHLLLIRITTDKTIQDFKQMAECPQH